MVQKGTCPACATALADDLRGKTAFCPSCGQALDPHAAAQLLPQVYDELRKLAAQRLAKEGPGQTLQATALVHEAYLRLAGTQPAVHWNGRGHFFAAAAQAMRRILVDNARRKRRLKRGAAQPAKNLTKRTWWRPRCRKTWWRSTRPLANWPQSIPAPPSW